MSVNQRFYRSVIALGTFFEVSCLGQPKECLEEVGGGGLFVFCYGGVVLIFLNKYAAGILRCLTCDSYIFTDEGFKNVCWWLFFSVCQNKECKLLNWTPKQRLFSL